MNNLTTTELTNLRNAYQELMTFIISHAKQLNDIEIENLNKAAKSISHRLKREHRMKYPDGWGEPGWGSA